MIFYSSDSWPLALLMSIKKTVPLHWNPGEKITPSLLNGSTLDVQNLFILYWKQFLKIFAATFFRCCCKRIISGHNGSVTHAKNFHRLLNIPGYVSVNTYQKKAVLLRPNKYFPISWQKQSVGIWAGIYEILVCSFRKKSRMFFGSGTESLTINLELKRFFDPSADQPWGR